MKYRKRCPLYVKIAGKRTEWFLHGYTYHFMIVDGETDYALFHKILYDVIPNLRDKKYEHFLVEFADNSFINFIQTVVYDKNKYRIEYSVCGSNGKMVIYMTNEKNAYECLKIFIDMCIIQRVTNVDWKDITESILKRNYA